MTASLLRFVSFGVVAAALLACGGSGWNLPPRYAEYSLDPAKHPESVDCFYGCLQSNREAFRDLCFSRCEGVASNTTEVPCQEGSPLLCRSYRVEEEARSVPESNSGGVAESSSDDDDSPGLLGAIVGAIVESAVDDDDEPKRARSAAKPRSRPSSSSRSRSVSPARGVTKVKSAFGSKRRDKP